MPPFQPLPRPKVWCVYKTTEPVKADLPAGHDLFLKDQVIPAGVIFILISWIDTNHNYAEIFAQGKIYQGAWILGKWRKLTNKEAQEYMTTVMPKI